jgi:hypothetical protein
MLCKCSYFTRQRPSLVVAPQAAPWQAESISPPKQIAPRCTAKFSRSATVFFRWRQLRDCMSEIGLGKLYRRLDRSDGTTRSVATGDLFFRRQARPVWLYKYRPSTNIDRYSPPYSNIMVCLSTVLGFALAATSVLIPGVLSQAIPACAEACAATASASSGCALYVGHLFPPVSSNFNLDFFLQDGYQLPVQQSFVRYRWRRMSRCGLLGRRPPGG